MVEVSKMELVGDLDWHGSANIRDREANKGVISVLFYHHLYAEAVVHVRQANRM